LIGYDRMKEREAALRAKYESELKAESARLQELGQTAASFNGHDRLLIVSGVLGGAAMVAGGIAAGKGTANPSDPGSPLPALVFAMGLIMGFLILVPFVAEGLSGRQKRRQEAKAYADKVDQLKQRLAARPKIDAPFFEVTAKKFGESLAGADYRKIFEERVPLIREVLGISGEIPADLAGVVVGGIGSAGALTVDEGKVRAAEGFDNDLAEAAFN
jgi:hypothetical protein